MPRPDDFPKFPATWYLFGSSRELHRPVTKEMLGTELTGFRTQQGRPVLLTARCSHLGADLGNGQVVGESLQCPFHGWRYGTDGACQHIPTSDKISPNARQRVYPVVERNGYVFFFNGPEPLFPLPFFPECDASDFIASPPLRFFGNCSWYMLTANGFDAQHFQYVHDRRLLEPVKVDEPAPFARRMRYRAEVSGHSIFDVLLRWFVGRTVEITITSYGGPLVLVTGKFSRVFSRIFISVRPLTPETTLTEVMVYAPFKTRLPFFSWTTWINLWIRRWFTWGFMFSDFERLQGIRYNPNSLIESDGPMIDFFRWAAELPRDVVWQDTPRTRCAMTESCVAEASTDGHSQIGTQSWMPQQNAQRLSSSVQS